MTNGLREVLQHGLVVATIAMGMAMTMTSGRHDWIAIIFLVLCIMTGIATLWHLWSVRR